MSQSKHIRFLFASPCSAIAPFSTFAQSSNGSIAGTVTDDSGGALPGVTITAVNAATGPTRSA